MSHLSEWDQRTLILDALDPLVRAGNPEAARLYAEVVAETMTPAEVMAEVGEMIRQLHQAIQPILDWLDALCADFADEVEDWVSTR